eukprot:110822-Hanusia_phi.AAC.1
MQEGNSICPAGCQQSPAGHRLRSCIRWDLALASPPSCPGSFTHAVSQTTGEALGSPQSDLDVGLGGDRRRDEEVKLRVVAPAQVQVRPSCRLSAPLSHDGEAAHVGDLVDLNMALAAGGESAEVELVTGGREATTCRGRG